MTSQTAPNEQYITKDKAAAILGVSPRRALELATSENKIRFERVRNPDTGMSQAVLLAIDVVALAQYRAASAHPQQSAAALPQLVAAPGTAVTLAPSAALAPQQTAAPVPTTEGPEIRLFDHFPPEVRLTPQEASAYLRIPATAIVALVRTGALPAMKLPGGGLRIRKGDLALLP